MWDGKGPKQRGQGMVRGGGLLEEAMEGNHEKKKRPPTHKETKKVISVGRKYQRNGS